MFHNGASTKTEGNIKKQPKKGKKPKKKNLVHTIPAPKGKNSPQKTRYCRIVEYSKYSSNVHCTLQYSTVPVSK